MIQTYAESSISLKQIPVMNELIPHIIWGMTTKYRIFGDDDLIHSKLSKDSHNKIDTPSRKDS